MLMHNINTIYPHIVKLHFALNIKGVPLQYSIYRLQLKNNK